MRPKDAGDRWAEYVCERAQTEQDIASVVRAAVLGAIAEERERCAVVAESYEPLWAQDSLDQAGIAAAIRARKDGGK